MNIPQFRLPNLCHYLSANGLAPCNKRAVYVLLCVLPWKQSSSFDFTCASNLASLQNMPNVRDHDASVYLRLQGDALSVGGYEENPIFWDEVSETWWDAFCAGRLVGHKMLEFLWVRPCLLVSLFLLSLLAAAWAWRSNYIHNKTPVLRSNERGNVR